MDLHEAPWPQVTAGTLVVPVGSCEQHGPHLPFDVDTAVAQAVVAALAEQPDVVAGPPLAYGASGEHEGFPGTVSIGTPVLTSVLVELGRSASRWADRLLLVNGHGGNLDACRAAVAQLRAEGRDAAWWPCAVPGDAHAGRSETSLLLALRPHSVGPTRDAGAVEPVAELLPRLRSSGVRAVSANGVLGDPRGASADEGRELLAALQQRTIAALRQWDVSAAEGRLAEAQGVPCR